MAYVGATYFTNYATLDKSNPDAIMIQKVIREVINEKEDTFPCTIDAIDNCIYNGIVLFNGQYNSDSKILQYDYLTDTITNISDNWGTAWTDLVTNIYGTFRVCPTSNPQYILVWMSHYVTEIIRTAYLINKSNGTIISSVTLDSTNSYMDNTNNKMNMIVKPNKDVLYYASRPICEVIKYDYTNNTISKTGVFVPSNLNEEQVYNLVDAKTSISLGRSVFSDVSLTFLPPVEPESPTIPDGQPYAYVAPTINDVDDRTGLYIYTNNGDYTNWTGYNITNGTYSYIQTPWINNLVNYDFMSLISKDPRDYFSGDPQLELLTCMSLNKGYVGYLKWTKSYKRCENIIIDVASGSTQIYCKYDDTHSYSNITVGETLTISDGTNSESKVVASVSSEIVYVDDVQVFAVTLTTALENSYTAKNTAHGDTEGDLVLATHASSTDIEGTKSYYFVFYYSDAGILSLRRFFPPDDVTYTGVYSISSSFNKSFLVYGNKDKSYLYSNTYYYSTNYYDTQIISEFNNSDISSGTITNYVMDSGINPWGFEKGHRGLVNGKLACVIGLDTSLDTHTWHYIDVANNTLTEYDSTLRSAYTNGSNLRNLPKLIMGPGCNYIVLISFENDTSSLVCKARSYDVTSKTQVSDITISLPSYLKKSDLKDDWIVVPYYSDCYIYAPVKGCPVIKCSSTGELTVASYIRYSRGGDSFHSKMSISNYMLSIF